MNHPYSAPEFPSFDAEKLVTPLPLDRNRATQAVAGAVRELGDVSSIRANGCHSLVRKLRSLFPELMTLRGDHDAAVAIRDRQVAELAPLLMGIGPDLDKMAATSDAVRESDNKRLDEITRRMWEISVTEQLIEAHRSRETALRDQILSVVNPAHLPLVRWALAQA